MSEPMREKGKVQAREQEWDKTKWTCSISYYIFRVYQGRTGSIRQRQLLQLRPPSPSPEDDGIGKVEEWLQSMP